jgi:hypothetical protein
LKKILTNIATFAINPVATILIYSILVKFASTSQLANFIFTMAIYNTFAIVSKLSTWQFTLVELDHIKNHSQVDIVIEKIFNEDFFHFLFCASILAICFELNLIQISRVELYIIMITGYFFNNSVVIGLNRYNETFFYLFSILIISLVLKIAFTIIMINTAPNYLISAIILVDFIIWAPVTIRLIMRSKVKSEYNFPKIHEIYNQRKVNFYVSSVATIPINQLDKILLYYVLDELLLSVYAIAQRGNVLFSILIEALNVLYIKMKGANSKKIDFLELKFTLLSFITQMMLLFSILLLFNVIDRFSFDNILQDFKAEIILFYICYIACASLFWIHTKAAKFLSIADYVNSIIYSILLYYAFLLVLVKTDAINFWSVLMSLVVQYITVISLRFYFLYPGRKNE